MRRLCLLASVFLALLGECRASDPVGIYAVIDKVEYEPSDSQPERVQLWGVFALAKKYDDSAEAGWRVYAPPKRGVMRFALTKGKEDLCRKEWNDLKKQAGMGQCVAFASRYSPMGEVAEKVDLKTDPIAYPIRNGIEKVESTSFFSQHLRAVPNPLSPDFGSRVDSESVTLKVANALGKDFEKSQYVFEITSSSGDKETSKPLEAGDKTTTWTPKMTLKPDVKYTWTVRIEDDKFKGFAATSSFKGKAKQ